MFTAHHMPLESTIINLPPAGMEPRKDVVLTAANQRLHMLEAKLLNPDTIRHEIAHLIIKHGQGNWRILHQSSQLASEFATFGHSSRLSDGKG